MTTAVDDFTALVNERFQLCVIVRRRFVKSSLQFRAGGRGKYPAFGDAGEILSRQIGKSLGERAQVGRINVER